MKSQGDSDMTKLTATWASMQDRDFWRRLTTKAQKYADEIPRYTRKTSWISYGIRFDYFGDLTERAKLALHGLHASLPRERKRRGLHVLFCFDEASALDDLRPGEANRFQILQRSLRVLINCRSCFAFFARVLLMETLEMA